MKLRFAFKILLLVLSMLLSGFILVLMYNVLMVTKEPFEYGMIIPLLMIPSGILSTIYHFKTLKYYKSQFQKMEFKDVLLWIGNGILSFSLVSTALYLFYSLYLIVVKDIGTEFLIAFSICLFMLVFGICLLLEEYFLHKRIINSKKQSHFNSIDDIKGHQDDEV